MLFRVGNYEKFDTLRCWLAKIKHWIWCCIIRQILTKCSENKQAYEVFCAKWTRKIWSKSILTLHRYRDFRVGLTLYISFCTPRISAPMDVFSHGGPFVRLHRVRISDQLLCDLMFAKCNSKYSLYIVIYCSSLLVFLNAVTKDAS